MRMHGPKAQDVRNKLTQTGVFKKDALAPTLPRGRAFGAFTWGSAFPRRSVGTRRNADGFGVCSLLPACRFYLCWLQVDPPGMTHSAL